MSIEIANIKKISVTSFHEKVKEVVALYEEDFISEGEFLKEMAKLEVERKQISGMKPEIGSKASKWVIEANVKESKKFK